MPPGHALPERESLARVALAGVDVVDREAVETVAGAVDAAERLGLPVVLKLDVVGIAHKSDIGAVRVGLGDRAAVEAAAGALLALELPSGVRRRGLLVARQLRGVELIVGSRRDESYGPVVLVGLGGILAEALDDVAVRLAPVDVVEALAMLDELRGRRVLDGLRGAAGIDRAAVAELIVAVGRAVGRDAGILELDLNPVISGPDGTAAVDALVVEAAP
jgi:hypothetical protein